MADQELVSETGRRLITIPELAQMLQLPESWIHARTKTDSIPGQIRLGKYVRFDPGEIAAWLDGLKPGHRGRDLE